MYTSFSSICLYIIAIFFSNLCPTLCMPVCLCESSLLFLVLCVSSQGKGPLETGVKFLVLSESWHQLTVKPSFPPFHHLLFLWLDSLLFRVCENTQSFMTVYTVPSPVVFHSAKGKSIVIKDKWIKDTLKGCLQLQPREIWAQTKKHLFFPTFMYLTTRGEAVNYI